MLQLKHIGGEAVAKGNYWNFSNGDRISMDNGGILPGGRTVTYYKANPLIVLALGPVLGLIYAAFLPFIGLAMIAKMLFTKLFGRTLERLSQVAAFNWSPAQAYLAGRRQKQGKTGSTANKEHTARDTDKK